MSTLGKVLLFLNLLGAILVFVLFPMTFGKQRAWSRINYLYDLRVEGLPLDNDEKDAEGNYRVARCSEDVLKELGLPAPIQTQMDMVKKVKGQVDPLVNATEEGATPEKNLARVLLPFAETLSEREALRDVLAGKPQPEGTAANLQQRYDNLFSDANPGPNRSVESRKRAVAHLLFGFAEVLRPNEEAAAAGGFNDSPLHKEIIGVVGYSAAARAVDGLAAAHDRIAAQGVQALIDERVAFIDHHGRLVYETLNQSDVLDRENDALAQVRTAAAAAKAARDKKKAEVDTLRKDYDQLRADTQGRLAEQAAREQEIFQRLVKLRETARQNQDLEKEIRTLEGAR